MRPYWQEHFLLPGQFHAGGRAVEEVIQQAREAVAALVGCDSFELVFTDGATEANNLAILGADGTSGRKHLLVSPLEHDSVLHAALHAGRLGAEVELLPCDREGVVQAEVVAQKLRPDTLMVCLQAANPMLGTIQPIRDVADICHRNGTLLHCDATQVFGKQPFDVTQLHADTVALSAHKFYGPKGAGALYVRRGLHLNATRFGESQEMGIRAGAVNVPAIVGLGVAADLSARCVLDAAVKLQSLTALFTATLQGHFQQPLRIACEPSRRLPNTLAVILPSNARKVQRIASQLVVATARPNDGTDPFSRMLTAIGASADEQAAAMRFSFGWTTNEEQVTDAAEILIEACERVRS